MTAPISGLAPIQAPHATAAQASSRGGEFQSALSSAIGSIESLQNNAANSIQQFLTGQNDELHSTILATQKAELAFELGLQVRNKVVDAYQEIMKMQM
ncbi:MAG TPA: flagellar hook-basal body complex protein FliE [Bryobacteraceae bacterium]|nr:flagellar hook-basal body complex protein FliE [Bryobacteraceae bacterium]